MEKASVLPRVTKPGRVTKQSYKVAQGWETLNELQGQAAAASKFSWKEEETTPLPQDNTLPPGLELGLPLSVASTGLRSR